MFFHLYHAHLVAPTGACLSVVHAGMVWARAEALVAARHIFGSILKIVEGGNSVSVIWGANIAHSTHWSTQPLRYLQQLASSCNGITLSRKASKSWILFKTNFLPGCWGRPLLVRELGVGHEPKHANNAPFTWIEVGHRETVNRSSSY